MGQSILFFIVILPLTGMNGAVETLTSQAYGANELKLCGMYLNRGRLINTVFFVPMTIILCFTESFLILLNQDSEVAKYAQAYALICLPGIYFQVMFNLKKRYLNCMWIAWVPMLTQIGSNPLHIFLCWLFVSHLGYGINGLGLATILTNFGLYAMVEAYSLCIPKIRESLFWPDAYALAGWGEYLKLGIPAMLMFCAETWAYEALILISGYLSVDI